MAEDTRIRRLREALQKARTFIEYARYELQPGKATFGDQFPKQADADAVVAVIESALIATAVLDTEGDRPMDKVTDLEEAAWGLIANVNGGDWNRQTDEWREAAVCWRGRYIAQITAADTEGDQPTPAGRDERARR